MKESRVNIRVHGNTEFPLLRDEQKEITYYVML